MLASTTLAPKQTANRVSDWYLMPESFSMQLVEGAIQEFGVKRGGTVLDPFCGTGTTLVAARLSGCNALGIEVNPFLCFASRVKTRASHFDLPLLRVEADKLLTAAQSEMVKFDENPSISLEDFPQLPEMPRLERWIARKVAVKVMVLRECIERCVSPENRDVPLVALASLLKGASNMKLSPHAFGSREVKHDSPVLTLFKHRLNKMLDDIEWLQGYERAEGLGVAEVIEGDIRAAKGLKHHLLPAELAITSPPYLNNLDYTMQTRLELFFLGFVSDMQELKSLRKRMMICDAKATYKDVEDWRRVEDVLSISRVAQAIDDKLGDRGWGWDYGRMTRQYFGGLVRALEAIHPMMARGAACVIILGESAHAGVLVPVPDLVAELGLLAGFKSADIKVLRTRRSSSHRFVLKESAVVLRA